MDYHIDDVVGGHPAVRAHAPSVEGLAVADACSPMVHRLFVYQVKMAASGPNRLRYWPQQK
jgi:hypothetical protein